MVNVFQTFVLCFAFFFFQIFLLGNSNLLVYLFMNNSNLLFS